MVHELVMTTNSTLAHLPNIHAHSSSFSLKTRNAVEIPHSIVGFSIVIGRHLGACHVARLPLLSMLPLAACVCRCRLREDWQLQCSLLIISALALSLRYSWPPPLGDEQDGRKVKQRMLLVVVFWLVTVKATTDPRDTAALGAFHNAIGDQMGRLSNWKGDDPCGAAWEGVICDFDGIHVIELRLLNHNLTGSLAPELGNLLSLQTLDVMWNNISGVIPQSLGNLQSLELLLLNGNSLTGEIPAELGNLPILRRLQLDENQIGGPIPPTFGNLTSVKHLHLNNNSLNGSIPPDLGRLPHLIHLLLDNNNLTGNLPHELSSISTLITLQLDNNRFDDPIIPLEYVQMPSLVKLSLQNCNLQGPIPALTRLTPLEYLGLGGNKLNETMPSQLPQNLTVFDASSNNLTGNISGSVVDLTKLQALILHDNRMGGAVPSFPQRASNDQLILDIQNNSFSAINSSLPEWLQLWVFGNPKICTGQFRFSPVCAPKNLTSVDRLLPPSDTICQKETCTVGVDELVPGLASDGKCRCATPITVVYRLKSPSFILFTPYAALLQQYLSNHLNLTSDQVFIDTSQWEPGHRRLRIHIKLFPAVLTQTAREFNQTETQRLYDAFARFQIPDTPLFGPVELVSFASGSLTNEKPERTGLSRGMLLVVVIVSVVGVSAIAVAGILVLFRRRSLAKPGNNTKFRTGLEGFKVAGVKSFTLEEMNKATDSFSETRLVGVGGYGNVYKGTLEDGSPVAVKRAREGSLQGSHEFQTEIELLSRIHHRNLVSLVGYCCDEGEQMLVYEFMPGATSRTRPCDFSTRLHIALGAARGILYLHTEANPPIIHRDIKASNILLDENNVAKVADFGLSKLAPAPPMDGSGAAGHISTVVKGTPGYLDPEYFLTHKLTDKSDVYSFGVVLLELITGMQAIQHGKNLVREVLLCYNAGTVLSIVDPRMGSYASDSLEPLVRLAIAACDPSIVTRPSMSDIVRSLENILQTVPWSIPQSNEKTIPHSNDKSDSKALLVDAYDDPSTTVYMNVVPR